MRKTPHKANNKQKRVSQTYRITLTQIDRVNYKSHSKQGIIQRILKLNDTKLNDTGENDPSDKPPPKLPGKPRPDRKTPQRPQKKPPRPSRPKKATPVFDYLLIKQQGTAVGNIPRRKLLCNITKVNTGKNETSSGTYKGYVGIIK